ncbi:MAG: ABC transporter permease [Lachnospiraceae bacterium]|nr:ABC transporter permease [Lachnospiraceae bacterium]
MEFSTFIRRAKKSPLFIVGGVTLIVIVLLCVLSPLYVVYDPGKADLTQRLLAPEWFSNGLTGHILGTDALGRDVLTRLLMGGRVSLFVSVVVVAISTLIGIFIGLIAGYFSGAVDRVVMRFADILMAIPSLMLAICVVAVLGTNFTNLIITLTLTSWVIGARIVRGNTFGIRNMEYVQAAKVMGTGNFKIMVSEVLPNVLTPIIVNATQQFGGTILTESSMSYLGMGIPVPTPSWGNMISEGREYLSTCPWVVIAPGIALMLTVLAFNFLGDGLRDILDPRNKD